MIQTGRVPKPFLSKVDTLLYLKNKLSFSNILELFSFTVSEYRKNSEFIFEKISTMFTEEIIIRSSASTEDQYTTNAGHFFSSQHINSQSKKSVFNGIESVISSYKRDGLTDSELIFIQKQLSDVLISGVAFSFEPKYGKPYFFVNFDDSGSTDSVTSGKCKQYMYIARDFGTQSNNIEAKLCVALREIEKYCDSNSLNVEFAITKDGNVYIFQVRQLRGVTFLDNYEKILSKKNIYKVEYSLNNILLSDMAFWNPSEIIGDAPHPLDYSLYNYLVTDSAWNQGIIDIGYSFAPEKLMIKIGNKPFINLKTAFWALTPASINNELRKKLVSYYCQLLKKNKNLHDKIEFEIANTCFDFSTLKKLSVLSDYGFKNEEIDILSDQLFEITKSTIEQYDTILSNDLKNLGLLENELNKYKNKLDSAENMLSFIAKILPLIRNYGTIPFARQARCAFIARSLCLSLVDIGQITSEQLEIFMRSINTIANELRTDVNNYNQGKMTKDQMIFKYGHLRSNTYNISSPTYAEMGIDMILNFENISDTYQNKVNGGVNLNINFPNTNINVIPFIKSSIAQREYFKFVFTKALSYVLQLISKIAKQFGFSCDEISFLTIDDILNFSIEDFSIKKNLAEIIRKRKQDFEMNTYILLPSVVCEKNDFDIIRVNQCEPNFITNKWIVGDVYIIDQVMNEKMDLSGKIVVLTNADPGFDWIFAQGSIIGLVTKYGGMASHMAIRCMEFGIPAAIGCGELIFDNVIKAKRIKLDCSAKKVVTVS